MRSSISPDCLDAFPEPLLTVKPSGRLISANQIAGKLLGIHSDGEPEVTLREITDLSGVELSTLLHNCLATTTPVPLRLSFYSPVGQPRSFRCEGWRCRVAGGTAAIIRIFDQKDATSHFSELTRLVDELNSECIARRRSETRLRAVLKQLYDVNSIRDHMLAQVSHDLRTPLNAILGMTEFMRREPFGPLASRYCDYIDDIHSSGDILLQLVDQVLHLTWDEAQSRGAAVEVLADLNECLANCCRVVEPIAKMRGLEIIIPSDVLLPRLRADQMLVKQILMNLLGNAARYTEKGGHIEVIFRWRRDGSLAILVKDDGPGIPKAKLAAINNGQLARSAYITDETKVGFGLVLSRRTAKAIGGRLDIRSAVGHGTVASLVLPGHLLETGQVLLH